MAGKGIIDTLFVFRLLRKLTMKYEKWDAYKSGVIDNKGNILLKKKERDKKDREMMGTPTNEASNMKINYVVPNLSSQNSEERKILRDIRDSTTMEYNPELEMECIKKPKSSRR